MRLRPASVADFAFIRALAQRPEYAPFITDQDEEALAGYLADPVCRLLIWEHEDRPAGFAILAGVGEPSGAVELLRLALAQAGGGEGSAFLNALIDYGFSVLGARRLWLDASSENTRAQRAYVRAGFTLEGRLRDHWYRPALGHNVDLLFYGLLRAEWQAAR